MPRSAVRHIFQGGFPYATDHVHVDFLSADTSVFQIQQEW